MVKVDGSEVVITLTKDEAEVLRTYLFRGKYPGRLVRSLRTELYNSDPQAKRPIDVKQFVLQTNFSDLEARAIVSCMREVGMEIVGDESIGTEEQYAEFKQRWMTRHDKVIEKSHRAKFETCDQCGATSVNGNTRHKTTCSWAT